MNGYVYVIQFSDESIKVGRTTDPQTRIARHIADAGKYGLNYGVSWVSDLCSCQGAERQLKAYCSVFGDLRTGTREYFINISFFKVVELATHVARFNPPDNVRSEKGALLDVDSRQAVLSAITSAPIRVTHIVQESGISRPTVYRRLNDLSQEGLITSPARGLWALVKQDHQNL